MRGRGINFYTNDETVIRWWESIPSRDRSKRLCELIKQAAGTRGESVTDRISAVNSELDSIRNVIICELEVSDRDDQLDNQREG